MKRSLLSALAVGLFMTANVMAQVPSYVPTNGLVGWWPFNGNANDESGNGNNGTVNGTTLTTDRFGNASSAYSFSGNNILIPLNQTIVNMPSRTINLWFNSSMSQSGGRLFETTSYSWGIGCYNSTQFDCWYQKSNKAYNAVNLNFGSHNTWHNLVYVCDSVTGNVKVYLNGVNIHSSNAVVNTGNPIDWINHFIKIGQGNANESFIGKIDDIAIWNRALTEQEITALYNSCSASTIITQPTNQTVNPTNSAQFIVNTSTVSSFQWQTDLGFGFQNLSNAGQYSGASNDTLVVSSVSVSNNNQQFRCIVSNAGCVDTSDIAILTVSTVGIEEIVSQTKFTLYPNPTQTSFEIQTNLVYAKIEVRDMQGRIVKTENTGKIINIASLQKGTYLVKLMDEKSKVIAIQRIIKE